MALPWDPSYWKPFPKKKNSWPPVSGARLTRIPLTGSPGAVSAVTRISTGPLAVRVSRGGCSLLPRGSCGGKVRGVGWAAGVTAAMGGVGDTHASFEDSRSSPPSTATTGLGRLVRLSIRTLLHTDLRRLEPRAARMTLRDPLATVVLAGAERSIQVPLTSRRD